METNSIPSDFVWRRLHSLAGLWLTIYIILHLFTNAQAAIPFGEDGKGFIHDVNWIHSLPFLNVIELAILGVPILIHAAFGVKYLFTGESNSTKGDGSRPYLNYGRNRAYTWQRITAWILLVGILAHVVHMRFIEYPEKTREGRKTFYTTQVSEDPGLKTLQERIDFTIMPSQEKGEVLIRSDNFGTTTLFMLRDTFKSPLMMALYTILVLTACFHGFNGLWTFTNSWGITLTKRSQTLWLRVCQTLMGIVAMLGLVAIYGTYWINLRQ